MEPTQQPQLLQYIAVLILLVIAVGATGGMIAMSMLLGKKGGTSKIKDTAYECGMLPIGAGAPRMSVKFYLVAMLFILFDIEVVFMYPWAVVYKELLADEATRNAVFGGMMFFIAMIVVGLIYEFKKKAFDWKS
jgi:NADH-quinone oxidoreductase subunit A